MTKTFYVLQHATGKFFKSKTGSGGSLDIQDALRVGTSEEAEALKKFVGVPLAWDVVPVQYDTLQGRVVEANNVAM